MANLVEFAIRAKNGASPEFQRAAEDLKHLERVTRSYGTATPEAQRTTQRLLDELKRARPVTDDASGGLGGVNKAAKDLAQGGLRDVLSEIPIVGGALSKLAGTLGGFPLLLGGIAGAGLGVLKFLQGMNEDATKATASMTALSEKIGADFLQTVREVQKIQAEASGDRLRSVELAFEAEIAAAERAKTEKIAKAKEELNQLDLFGRRRTELSQEALAEIAAAEADAANATVLANAKRNAELQKLEEERKTFTKSALAELVAAEAEAAQAVLKARGEQIGALEANVERERALLEQTLADRLAQIERLNATAMQKLEERRVAEETFQARVVTLEQEAADKRKAILESLTSASLEIFRGLGEQFADVVQTLEVAQLAQQTQNALTTLHGALEAGVITQKQYAEASRVLTERLQDAVRLGFVPTTEAADKTSVAMTTAAGAAEAAGSSIAASLFRAGAAAQETIEILDMLIARGRAAQQAANQAAQGPAPAPGSSTSSGPTGDPILDSRIDTSVGGFSGATGGVTSPSSGSNPQSFAHGGVVPGVPAIVHPGEAIGPPETLISAFVAAAKRIGGDRGGSGPTVQIASGAIQINGRVIQAERDWAVLVEDLGRALDARAKRRGG
jgi:hypothetical protein